MLYRIIKKKSKQIFLDNWTIQIRIFGRFRCGEQVKYIENSEIRHISHSFSYDMPVKTYYRQFSIRQYSFFNIEINAHLLSFLLHTLYCIHEQ